MLTNQFHEAIHGDLLKGTSSPSPGNDAEIVVPQFDISRLIHLNFRLVTDANVANRIVWLQFNTPGFVMQVSSAVVLQVASSTFDYMCMPSTPVNAATPFDALFLPLPSFRVTDRSADFTIKITNIQVGDQISDIESFWETWRGAG